MVGINRAQIRMFNCDTINYNGYIVRSEAGSTGIIIEEDDHIFIKSLNHKSISDPEIEHLLKEKYNLEEVNITGTEPFLAKGEIKIIGSACSE